MAEGDNFSRALTRQGVEALNGILAALQALAPTSIGTFTVAGLPSAATAGQTARAWVTDANATTFASIVAGGGTNFVPVFSDATNWRIG